MSMNYSKDGVLSVHATAQQAATTKLPGLAVLAEIPESQLNGALKPRLAADFDKVVTTIAMGQLESEGMGEVMVQEIALEDVKKAMQDQDAEYIVGMLTMLGLMPLPDDPELKAKAFAAYVRNIQDDNPELEAIIDGWFFADSEEKLAENREQLQHDNQAKEDKEDAAFMKDFQHAQMVEIALPLAGLNSRSSRGEVVNALNLAVVTAKQKNPQVKYNMGRLKEAENMVMMLLEKHPELTVTKIKVQQDGEINLVFAKGAVLSGLRILPDAAFESVKVRGEAATSVAPALMFFTDKSNDIANKVFKGDAVTTAAAGANHNMVTAAAKEEGPVNSPFKTNPFDMSCGRR